MNGQRLVHTAYRRIIPNPEMRSVIRFLLAAAEGTLPASHHEVLQDRQLIRIFVGGGQRTLNKRRIDLTADKLDGFTDHVLPLNTSSCRALGTGSG